MKYSTILLSAIAATGAMAAPQRGGQDSNTQGTGKAPAGGATVQFGTTAQSGTDDKSVLTTLNVNNLGGFSFKGIGNVPSAPQVTLTYGDGVTAKPRCKANDKDGNAFVVERNGNMDFTFADGTAWKFKSKGKDAPAAVAEVICDATFKKLETNQQGAVVELGKLAKDPNPFITRFDADALKNNKATRTLSDAEAKEYKFVTLKLGPQAFNQNPALRCRISIQDKNDKQKFIPIKVSRGGNTFDSFGDGFKGVWRFPEPTVVNKVECSDDIKTDAAPEANAPGAGNTPDAGSIPENTGGRKPQGGPANNEDSNGAGSMNNEDSTGVVRPSPGSDSTLENSEGQQPQGEAANNERGNGVVLPNPNSGSRPGNSYSQYQYKPNKKA